MNWNVATYVAYLVITVPLVVWVATELSRNGLVFLEDVFTGDERLATAVNKLLVVGFYLLNLGFVSLYLRSGATVAGLQGMLEALSVKVGVVALVLGTVHFLNVWVFSGMRRRHRQEAMRPAAPQYWPPQHPAYPAP